MSMKNSLEKASAIFGAPNEPKCVFMAEETKEKMINEPFDITKHEIVDYGYIGVKHDKNLYVKKSGFTIDKERSIAIAKALGVTGEDLK